MPVCVESRAKGKKVTVIRNVSGDAEGLLHDLKHALGSGGVARATEVEIQGEHVPRVEAFLSKSGCLAGVTRAAKEAAIPPAKAPKKGKTIGKLDKKAQDQKQKQNQKKK